MKNKILFLSLCLGLQVAASDRRVSTVTADGLADDEYSEDSLGRRHSSAGSLDYHSSSAPSSEDSLNVRARIVPRCVISYEEEKRALFEQIDALSKETARLSKKKRIDLENGVSIEKSAIVRLLELFHESEQKHAKRFEHYRKSVEAKDKKMSTIIATFEWQVRTLWQENALLKSDYDALQKRLFGPKVTLQKLDAQIERLRCENAHLYDVIADFTATQQRTT
jgi:hypothetical protein